MSRPARFLSCEKCGGVVKREKTSSRYCSHACARASRKRNACSVDGCVNGRVVSGYCPMHAKRIKVHGDPSTAARILLGTCGSCGKAYTYPAKASQSRWCSRKCANDAAYARDIESTRQSDPVPCARCGAFFHKGPRIPVSDRYFCSRRCSGMASAEHRATTARCRVCEAEYVTANPIQRICKSCARTRRLRSISVRNRRRKALRRGALGPTHTEAEWNALLDRHGRLCAYCREKPAEHRDHVMPVSRNGSDAIDNILPACARCNTRKGAILPEAWRQKLQKEYGRAW